jgi:hypothetical protein
VTRLRSDPCGSGVEVELAALRGRVTMVEAELVTAWVIQPTKNRSRHSRNHWQKKQHKPQQCELAGQDSTPPLDRDPEHEVLRPGKQQVQHRRGGQEAQCAIGEGNAVRACLALKGPGVDGPGEHGDKNDPQGNQAGRKHGRSDLAELDSVSTGAG